MSASMYKVVKESFYVNHNGTSTFEINEIITVAPISLLLQKLFIYALRFEAYSNGSYFLPKWFKVFSLDFLFLVLPLTLTCTVWNEHVSFVLLVELIVILFLVILIIYKPMDTSSRKEKKVTLYHTLENAELTGNRRPFLTNFRAYLQILTSIAILGVDFTVFPRRYAKAENFGTGLMDAGVGAFVISSALVSPEVRAQGRSVHNSGWKCVKKSVISSLPLLMLGLVRYFSVSATDYHQHVTEYGLHWNFYFTLAVVRIFSALGFMVISYKNSGLLSVALVVFHQYLLSNYGLQNLILFGSNGLDSREGFFDANREGLFSCITYLALYFAGVEIGRYLFVTSRKRLYDWAVVLLNLIGFNMTNWLCFFLCSSYLQPVSRRLANLSFYIWVIAYSTYFIICNLLVEFTIVTLENVSAQKQYQGEKTRHGQGENIREHQSHFTLVEGENFLLNSINTHQLSYFLLANLLTGLVNFSINTLETQSFTSVALLIGYMLILSGYHNILYSFYRAE